MATLTITDVDGGGSLTITSPMSEANLKGCHPIQNLGAVETYTRRYLWVTAMEIVEHDALDATTGKDKKAAIQEQEQLKDVEDAEFDIKREGWKASISSGQKTVTQLAEWLESRGYKLSDNQFEEVCSWLPK